MKNGMVANTRNQTNQKNMKTTKKTQKKTKPRENTRNKKREKRKQQTKQKQKKKHVMDKKKDGEMTKVEKDNTANKTKCNFGHLRWYIETAPAARERRPKVDKYGLRWHPRPPKKDEASSGLEPRGRQKKHIQSYIHTHKHMHT